MGGNRFGSFLPLSSVSFPSPSNSPSSPDLIYAPEASATTEAAPEDPGLMAEAGPLVLEASKILDAEDLARVLPLVAGPSHNYGKTRILPGSAVVERSESSVQPVFLHSIVAGLVPPFSDFFLAVLTHYDIHLLHLQPNSIAILSIFAFSARPSWA